MKKYIGTGTITTLGLLLFLSLSKFYDPNEINTYIFGIAIKPLFLFGFYTYIIGIITITLLLIFDLISYLKNIFKKWAKSHKVIWTTSKLVITIPYLLIT